MYRKLLEKRAVEESDEEEEERMMEGGEGSEEENEDKMDIDEGPSMPFLLPFLLVRIPFSLSLHQPI